MDLGPEFFKTFQFSAITYCTAPQNNLSFDFGLYHAINSTYLVLSTKFFQSKKGETWKNVFFINTFNKKYPSIGIRMIPFTYFMFEIYYDRYFLQLSPIKNSLFLDLGKDSTMEYGITYNIKTPSSIIMSLNRSYKMFLTANFSENSFTMFYKLLPYKDAYFYLGLKMTNRHSFFKSFDEIYVGSLERIYDSFFSIGYALSNPYKIAISRRKNNYRLTYIVHLYFDYDKKNNHYVQYKYCRNNLGKVGFLYDFSQKTLHMRSSARLFRNFKIKTSLKFNGKFYGPTFGFSFSFP